MAAVAGHLEMPSRGVEVARFAAGRRDRAGFALTHRVNVHPVESWSQLTRFRRLDGDGHVAAGESEVCRRHRGTAGILELGGQLVALGCRLALALTGLCRGRGRPGPDGWRGTRLRRRLFAG